MVLWQLAWRNVGRNRRRTLITAASVVVAVFFVVLMESFNRGVSDYLVDNEIRLYTAHVEINHSDFLVQRRVEHAMRDTDELLARLRELPAVTGVARRLELLAMASAADESAPVIVWGAETNPSPAFFDYATVVDHGQALPGQLVLGEALAAKLGVVPGDSVVLVGQSYFGRIAAGLYRVSGIAGIPIPDVSNHVVFAPIDLVQQLADIPDGATSLFVNLSDKELATQLKDPIEEIARTAYQAPLSVRSWEDILSGRMATYRLRAAGVMVLKLVMYVLLAFGILGTIMLTNNERQREYNTLMAIGMKRHRLAASLLLEMLVTTCFGLAAGLLLVTPAIALLYHYPIRLTGELADIMARFNVEPIIMMSMKPIIFVNSTVVVFLITLVITVVATASAMHRKPIQGGH